MKNYTRALVLFIALAALGQSYYKAVVMDAQQETIMAQSLDSNDLLNQQVLELSKDDNLSSMEKIRRYLSPRSTQESAKSVAGEPGI